MANASGQYLMSLLKNPNLPANQDDETDFLAGQGGANALPALAPAPQQAQGTLQNPVGMNPAQETLDRTPASMLPPPTGPINKTSDTKTDQTVSKTKNYADDAEWNNLIAQAGGSAPIQAEQAAIDAQKAQAQAYADRMAGRDTNNYSAIGAAADNLNSINGTKSNFADVLEKQAQANDPKKIQDEILKNFADVTKAQQGVGTNTLKAVNDMATGDTQNKAIDAQMQGLQAFNPQMVDQRNERLFQTFRKGLVNDPQLTAIGGYVKSLGTGMNQLGQNTLPGTVAELTNIANVAAGAGTGLSAAERDQMGFSTLKAHAEALANYLNSDVGKQLGLKDPTVVQAIDRIKNEHAALLQYYSARADTIANNPTLLSKNPAYQSSVDNTVKDLKNSINFTPTAQAVENGTSPGQTTLDHSAIDAEIARRAAMKKAGS